MCGIAGIYRFPGKPLVQESALQKMGDSLAHRGPDDRGLFIFADQRIGLAHTRLSIIDLTSAGHQPMLSRDGKIAVIFNGEIYNFRSLKRDLVAAGYQFVSESDTEVLVCGYAAWGIEGLLHRLRGMFAFALVDARSHEPQLFLCRDRFGIKPLYWQRNSDGLMFASEARTIAESVGTASLNSDTDAPALFFMFGHIPSEGTMWKDIRMLPASSYLSIRNDTVTAHTYYDRLAPFLKEKKTDADSLTAELKELLQDTVDIHCISDAPLGIFLSGGLDSSALVAYAALRRGGLTTLSVDFDVAGASETRYQQAVSRKFHTNHRQISIGQRDFWDEFGRIFQAMDQPTVDGVNTYFISRAASQVGLKAVLSGTGADEIFCGYRSFRSIGLLRGLARIPAAGVLASIIARGARDPWRKLQFLGSRSQLGVYLSIRGLFSPIDTARLLGISHQRVMQTLSSCELAFESPRSDSLSALDWLSYEEICWYLNNQLLKDTDCMSMCHGVETRVPYLDHLLIEAVASAQSSLKRFRNHNKPLLAALVADTLPKEVIVRKKQGFMFPIGDWMREAGRDIFESSVADAGMDRQCCRVIWDDFYRGRTHWSRVWSIIVLGKWMAGNSH